MAEYIERDKAVEKITAYCELRQAICINDKDEYLRGLQTALKAISYNDVIPNEDVQPVNQWISVKDRLPENNKPVLCFVIDTTGEGRTYVIGSCEHSEFWFLKIGDNKRFSFPHMQIKVTHWQPLPKPPKEGDTNGK